MQVLATRYPRYLLRFSNRHEETYAALMLLIERHYLNQWGMMRPADLSAVH